MTTITYIRHGETDWNNARRIQGSTDIPLNDTGRAQAAATGARLAERIDPATAWIATSDLSRARETAQIVAAAIGIPQITAYASLRERSYGDAEGLDIAEYHSRFAAAAEVPGAETSAALRERAVAATRRVVADARATRVPAPQHVLIVAHGALIRELIAHASGEEFPLEGERLANASTHEFFVERERLRLLSYAAIAAA